MIIDGCAWRRPGQFYGVFLDATRGIDGIDGCARAVLWRFSGRHVELMELMAAPPWRRPGSFMAFFWTPRGMDGCAGRRPGQFAAFFWTTRGIDGCACRGAGQFCGVCLDATWHLMELMAAPGDEPGILWRFSRRHVAFDGIDGRFPGWRTCPGAT